MSKSSSSDLLRANVLLKQYVLEVDLTHVSRFHEELAAAIQDRPGEVLPLVCLFLLYSQAFANLYGVLDHNLVRTSGFVVCRANPKPETSNSRSSATAEHANRRHSRCRQQRYRRELGSFVIKEVSSASHPNSH